MNKLHKFIIKNGCYYLILQTEGEADFWVWQVQIEEFNNWLHCDMVIPTMENLELFANDVNNDTIGTSWSSFDTVEKAEEDINNG